MENFILYEELDNEGGFVFYKGRRKGSLCYVAIICTDKTQRPEITNHVRLSQDLDHPHIVRFYEWFETSKNLWVIVELCSGGSLESVVTQDRSLPEDIVRMFGWDLVKGLRHIHGLGIVLSDLDPAKILLDASGILKFSDFCLSKNEGETLEDIFTTLSACGESEGGGSKNMRTRVQGSLAYSAPEVLQGSETSRSSDLWALGCILYYMYTGKPPFCSDDNTHLTEMILQQEPPPLKQTAFHPNPPSQEFQNLLKGLLNKDPTKRISWSELVYHPFWTQVKEEEDDAIHGVKEDEDADRHRKTCGPFPAEQTVSLGSSHSAISQPGGSESKKTKPFPAAADTGAESQQSVTPDAYAGRLKSSKSSYDEGQVEPRVLPEPRGVEELSYTPQPTKSYMTGEVLELKPKSGLNQDNYETIFLLRCAHSSSRSQCSISSNQNSELEVVPDLDVTTCVKRLLYTDSDLSFTQIIDNPKILKSTPIRFDAKSLCVPAYSVEKLLSLSDNEWKGFLSQLHSCLEEKPPSMPVPSSAALPQSTAVRSKLNLLCYLCCIAGHTVIADRLINSTLFSALTQQLRQAPKWNLRSKILRALGLLALHCSHLEEDCHVSEAVSTLTDLLRDNLRNDKLKQVLLPPLGELLYLMSSEEEKRGSPEGLWFIPAAAYTGLMRSLREGNDAVVHHMAAKAIDNISSTASGFSRHLATTEMGLALWYLFTHSTAEAIRVTAMSSLSRLSRLDPAVFLSVIDTCGPAAVLEGIGGAGSRVQQHLLTAVASALLASHIHKHRITQSRDLVLNVLRCFESPSAVTRAKAMLLVLLLIQDNTHMLLYCCQHRLVMYLERDLRKATPVRDNPSQSGYLLQCLDLLLLHLSHAAPLITEDVLSVLRDVIGRKHPSAAQSRQLKQTLPTLSVVLELLSSQAFRARIVTKEFLVQMGLLLNYIISVDSSETNLSSAVGATICQELIRTSLSIVEVLSQHHTLITQHHYAVVDAILPPLTTLAFSRNVEWSVFVLKVLSELSLILLVQDDDEDESEDKAEKGDLGDRGRTGQVLSVIIKSLLSRVEDLLCAAEPVPLYALKLLISMTEHSTQICRWINHSRILPAVYQLIMANSITSGTVKNAVVLLCNLSGDTVKNQQQQQELMEVLVSTLSEAALVYLDQEKHAGKKISLVVLQALLEILNNILKQISVVVRAALQSQRLSCSAAETEAAEKLLVANRPLSQLSTPLIHMLSTDNQEVWEESIQCLSLLAQLYGGEGQDCLSPSCLQSFSHLLRAHMNTETPRIPRTALRILKRLIQTTDQPDWFKCPEGVALTNLLQDIAASNRCHADVTVLAAEILQEVSGSSTD
ncbi:serine/threonine-protein kinase ULK4 isoform X1 [Cyprinodon tularosa]|uniref:serine/threonine-protein kinase ULK4 isoform X1 n=1 Tax=Cyprinodon tularosa TaxID=77115 RepID=UPI0018E26D72|nr:serine/threonine-protein kinase ULK4 isoform X1 [Cyprinodon tularosa]XP_038131706.1 serine/threonine-protein kinase ULK4 isoform X1 [Cyprinodon tularosa]